MLKIVAVSDTHGLHRRINVPFGDVLIHCGDFCRYGNSDEEVKDLANWMGGQRHKHKIVIPGNHDKPAEKKPEWCRKVFEEAGIHLLINDEIVIDGIKFWGSPVTPRFFNWHFMKNRGKDMAEVWKQIPEDADVIMTHGPPYGHNDLVPPYRSSRPRAAGCLELLKRLKEIQTKTGGKYPRYHVFGHIHAGHGASESDECENIYFINASTCTESYKPLNLPIEFTITSYQKDMT